MFSFSAEDAMEEDESTSIDLPRIPCGDENGGTMTPKTKKAMTVESIIDLKGEPPRTPTRTQYATRGEKMSGSSLENISFWARLE